MKMWRDVDHEYLGTPEVGRSLKTTDDHWSEPCMITRLWFIYRIAEQICLEWNIFCVLHEIIEINEHFL